MEAYAEQSKNCCQPKGRSHAEDTPTQENLGLCAFQAQGVRTSLYNVNIINLKYDVNILVNNREMINKKYIYICDCKYARKVFSSW